MNLWALYDSRDAAERRLRYAHKDSPLYVWRVHPVPRTDGFGWGLYIYRNKVIFNNEGAIA